MRRALGETASCAPSSAASRRRPSSSRTGPSVLRAERARDRAAPLDARARRRPHGVPTQVQARSVAARPPITHLQGKRVLRVDSVAQALLRALCGQLIESRRARAIERRIIREFAPREGRRPARRADLRALARVSPGAVPRARTARAARRGARPHLPRARPRTAARAADRGRRAAASARARPRPVVARRRLRSRGSAASSAASSATSGS